jgi:hypothetical protein
MTLSLDLVDCALLGVTTLLFTLLLGAIPYAAELMGRFAWKLIVSVAILPLVIRRRFFVMPRRSPIRTGALWSLLGIVGLLAVALGLFMTAIFSWSVTQAMTREPDEVALHATDALPADAIDIDVVLPGESEADMRRRVARDREDSTRRWRASEAAIDHERWTQAHTMAVQVAAGSGAAAVALFILAASLERLRRIKEQAGAHEV